MNKKMFITKRIFPPVATAIVVSGLYMNVASANTSNISSSDILLGDKLNISAGYYEDDTIINIPTVQEVVERNEISLDDLIAGDKIEGVKAVKSSYYTGGNNSGLNNGLSSEKTSEDVSIEDYQTLNLGVNEKVTLPSGYYFNPVTVRNNIINRNTLNRSLNAGEYVSIPEGYYKGGKITANSLASQTIANADSEKLLTGYTAWVNGAIISGTMPNNGAPTPTLNAGDSYTIAPGYYSGGKVTVNSLASQTVANSGEENILSGYTAWVNGKKISGNMTNNGAKSATLNTATTYYTIPKGYHNGNGKIDVAYEERSITAGTGNVTVTPNNNKFITKVTVAPTPSQSKPATPTGSAQTIYPDSGKLLSSVSISAVTKSSGIGKTLYDEGYGSGRTQGRSDVTSNPNSYNLYTKSQYDNNYNSGRTQGRSDVTSAPNSYSLYTKTQYDTNYNSGRTQGQNDVKNNPNSYSLYTKSQYDNNYNSGRTQGRSDVTSSPNSYSLYTKSQYDDNYTSGYNNGFDKGKRYILGNRAHHLAVGSAGGTLANCTFNLHDVLDGTTIKFYNMSSGDNKRIVILDAGRGSTTLYDSGYTSSTNLSYTVASGGIISVQLWTKDGTPQYSSFMLENSNY